jgi:hypothetical protein
VYGQLRMMEQADTCLEGSMENIQNGMTGDNEDLDENNG